MEETPRRSADDGRLFYVHSTLKYFSSRNLHETSTSDPFADAELFAVFRHHVGDEGKAGVLQLKSTHLTFLDCVQERRARGLLTTDHGAFYVFVAAIDPLVAWFPPRYFHRRQENQREVNLHVSRGFGSPAKEAETMFVAPCGDFDSRVVPPKIRHGNGSGSSVRR